MQGNRSKSRRRIRRDSQERDRSAKARKKTEQATQLTQTLRGLLTKTVDDLEVVRRLRDVLADIEADEEAGDTVPVSEVLGYLDDLYYVKGQNLETIPVEIDIEHRKGEDAD